MVLMQYVCEKAMLYSFFPLCIKEGNTPRFLFSMSERKKYSIVYLKYKQGKAMLCGFSPVGIIDGNFFQISFVVGKTPWFLSNMNDRRKLSIIFLPNEFQNAFS